ncbi:hypothetical protein RI129_007420 [Pyrocoelia pectoralis]|uniref:Uncharacterized protein n=1 Tax=Pyrocoelia pectoralis TaxID=417401 RepID=A0AAN7V7Z8_9COLE
MKHLGILIWVYISTATVIAQENFTSVVSAKLTVLDESVTINPESHEALNKHEVIQLQPAIAESRSSTQLNRTALPINSSTTLNKKFSDFRPSQPLETYYEYNRFPVVPAQPEAKYFSGVSIDDKPMRFEDRPWIEKANIVQLPSTTIRSYISNKIKFPTTTQSTYQTINEQAYPFLTNLNYLETSTRSPYPYALPGSEYTTPKTSNYDSQQGYTKFGGTGVGNALSGITNKFGDLFSGKNSYFPQNPISVSASGYGGNPTAHKTHFEQQQVMIPTEGAMMPSPWKKVIGFLTAIIPLGLLISALTPSFINVPPANTTEARARVNGRKSTKDLIHSLHYINALGSKECEEKVICEILLRTGSTSAETNAERLLRILSEQDKNILKNHMEEVKHVLDAVKSRNCNLLACGNKNDTREYDIKKERKFS